MYTTTRVQVRKVKTLTQYAAAAGTPRSNGADKTEPPQAGALPKAAARKTFFIVLAIDEKLKRLTPFDDADELPPPQDPCDERARHIDFHFNRHRAEGPPPEQLVFVAALEKLVHLLNQLRAAEKPMPEVRFRHYYVEVFSLAKLVLQDGLLGIDAGKNQLAAFEQELIDNEGLRVRNDRIRDLVLAAGRLSIPFLAVYVVLALLDPQLNPTLLRLHINPATLASFMVLWIGSFLGVCLSYGMRRPKLTVDDLMPKTEPDFYRPVVRLAFAGTLTMILVMFAMLNFIDLSVADLRLSKAVDPGNELLAFVLGIICGTSELLLPARILGQTSRLLPGTQPAT